MLMYQQRIFRPALRGLIEEDLNEELERFFGQRPHRVIAAAATESGSIHYGSDGHCYECPRMRTPENYRQASDKGNLRQSSGKDPKPMLRS
jgi:hypothetical protein